MSKKDAIIEQMQQRINSFRDGNDEDEGYSIQWH